MTTRISARSRPVRGGAPAAIAQIVVALLGAGSATALAQPLSYSWVPLGAGMDLPVDALVEFDGDVVAGGMFDFADQVFVNHVGRWNGTTWEPLSPADGSGLEASVRALVPIEGSLYAGGDFSINGANDLVRYVAVFDGIGWSEVGGGTTGPVFALELFDDGGGSALYVGGQFFTVGGLVSAENIAKWDGASWSALGSGLNAHVEALAVFDDGTGQALYAGGVFTATGDGATEVKRIAKWDGSTWTAVGGGFDGTVHDLAVFDGKLVAGGSFGIAGGVLAHNLAQWDGTSWSELGDGTSAGFVHDLSVGPDGKLYVGGHFSHIGPFLDDIEVNHVARWDGSSWEALGEGVDNDVDAVLTTDENGCFSTYVGGYFNAASGQTAHQVAKFTQAPGIAVPLASQIACAGSDVTFSVAALGAQLAYQWKKDGIAITIAGNWPTYEITAVDDTDVGVYSVTLSNPCGSVTSGPALLTVKNPPSITAQPQSQAVCVGVGVTFTVVANANPIDPADPEPLSYQWKKWNGMDFVNISGATAAAYTIAAVQQDNAGLYMVKVSTPFCAKDSAVVTLTVLVPPSITIQPESQVILVNNPVTFSVVATGTALSYQWKKNGVNVPGANAAMYTIAAVHAADAGNYTCVVSNACEPPVTSAVATLTVLQVCPLNNGNDCCQASPVGTPGCENPACCAAVCAIDPFCCEVSWDGICAAEADGFPECNCPVCGVAPPPNDCCQPSPSGTPGCSDPACEAAVCDVDPFCCAGAWDGLCAGEASQFCPHLCPPLPYAASAKTMMAIAPSTAWADRGATEKERVKNELRQREVMYQASAHQRPVPPMARAPRTPQSRVNDTGNVAPDRPAVASRARATDAPEGGVCNPSNPNDCFVASPSGTPGCNDVDCCNAVCAVDGFCCSVAWDSICAGEAASLCGEPCDLLCPGGLNEGSFDPNCGLPPGDSTCCFANGGLGCDDAACQACVCGIDAFCCDVAWDGICAFEAADVCAASCPCAEDPDGGCNAPSLGVLSVACGDTICGTGGAVGDTRDTDWLEFNLAAPTEVTLTVNAEFPAVAGLLDDNCSPFVFAFVMGPMCQNVVATACLPAGTHRAFVAPSVFDGVPCPSDYIATLTCGAACVPLACGNSANDCCAASPNFTPFCSDEDCCNAVCAIDRFCCNTIWDGVCAAVANTLPECDACFIPPPPNDNCADRILIDDGATPFSTLGATTDGPPHPECLKGFGDPQVNKDIWYNWIPDCGGAATADTLGSGFDTKLAVYDGCNCPIDPALLLCCNDDALGTLQSKVAWVAVGGQCYKIRIGGFGQATGDGILNVASAGDAPASVSVVSANPPLDNPFVAGVQAFVDPLQNRGGGFGAETLQGIGDPDFADPQNTPNEASFVYGAITFNLDGDACALSLDQVTVTCSFAPGVAPANPLNDCPIATGIAGSGVGPYALTLSGPIPAGACTSITLQGITGTLRYGYNPGDANGNGTVAPTDVLVTVGRLNSGFCPLGACTGDYCAVCDFNRSQSIAAGDVLRQVALLNGVNTTQPWLTVNLPVPCP